MSRKGGWNAKGDRIVRTGERHECVRDAGRAGRDRPTAAIRGGTRSAGRDPGSTGGRGYGGVGVRLWTRVTNPNPFGFTLSTLAGTLFLEDARAATVEFPLGLPLAAGRSEVIPIDISISFSELPQLGGVLERAINRRPIQYRLDGTIAVQAGQFGTPVFGPMTLLRGTARGNWPE